MKILVTGGAGYIGSHTCKELARQGHSPLIVDNLVYGHEWAAKWGPLHKFDIGETEKLTQLLKQEKPEAVIHFAAYAYVGESVQNPLKYYHNNVTGTLSLLQAMKNANVQNIVFSSTCATYGLTKTVPIEETFPQDPINPYGQSKLMVEKIIKDVCASSEMNAVILRYFNASGADVEGEIGEDHNPETHLIPLAIQAAFKPDKPLTVMGTDYDTQDGTCVRDYIHVTDLATAHIKSVEHMKKNPGCHVFNLGTGRGTSVSEVVESIERCTGRKVNRTYGTRRAGDPPRLVANGNKAKSELGWQPQYSEIDQIIKTACQWYESRFV